MGDVRREPIGPEVKFVNIHEKVKWKGIKLVGGYGDTGTSFNNSVKFLQPGSKEVPIIGLDDKRQITLVPSVALDGCVLLVQVIFQGKTERCLPAKSIRDLYSDWNFTYSENHWSNLGIVGVFFYYRIHGIVLSVALDVGLLKFSFIIGERNVFFHTEQKH